jgi:hypothetical protein
MSHMAIVESRGANDPTTWLAPVSEEEYTAANKT